MGRDRFTNCRERYRDHGFTLVEVMIVVFIIALMSTVVVMNLPEARPGAAQRADTLVRDLSRASREAIVAGEPIALSISDDGYRFERFQGGYWTPGRLHSLGDGTASGGPIVLTLDGEGREGAGDTGEGTDSLARAVIFSPVGEATPARLLLTSNRTRVAIDIDASGTITRYDPDAGAVQ